ncbi:hypothetical protein BVRB_4g080830 [Beta vulgaris subsp. vulgaris]|nr:hypothetical protein BVRB_4g080830 [Beta vulgaris subsp. vulgaris]
MKKMVMMNFSELPEDCVSTILSLCSPQDVCRSAAACSELRSAAELDCVWESFLPVDYHEIISRADPSLLKFSTKKGLFFLFCNSVLIDGGNKTGLADSNHTFYQHEIYQLHGPTPHYIGPGKSPLIQGLRKTWS